MAITGKVIKIIDSQHLLINKGSIDGVKPENRFLIYREGEEIFDPDTKNLLGLLSLYREKVSPHTYKKISQLFTAARQKLEQEESQRVIIRRLLIFLAQQRK